MNIEVYKAILPLHMTSVPVVVTGHLVEEPSHSLYRRIKLVSFVYMVHSAWGFTQLSSQHSSTVQWLHLAITTAFLAFLLPMCGMHAARKPGSGILAVFTGVQGCLGCWNMMSLGSLVLALVSLTMVCETCAPVFAAGNHTCFLQDSNTTFHYSSKVLDVPSSVCAKSIPSISSVISGVLMFGMALSSCATAVHGRKTGKAKMVHVVTAQPVSFRSSPMIVRPPPIPEDT
jgi:hypothetical protein